MMATPILDWLRDAPLWAAGAALFLAQLVMREAGAVVERRQRRTRPDGEDDPSQTGFIVSAILGLLALLIGFTFSLALGRFEARQTLANQEANALATVYDRLAVYRDGARFAPAVEAHARQRWDEVMGRASTSEPEAAKRKDRLWQAAVAVAAAEQAPPLVPFLLGPLGESFDRAEESALERSRRIDGGVLSMLVLLAVASAFTVGLTAPEARHRGIAAMLFLLLTMALLSILDLDQPIQGRSQLSDEAWQHAVAGMTGGGR